MKINITLEEAEILEDCIYESHYKRIDNNLKGKGEVFTKLQKLISRAIIKEVKRQETPQGVRV